MVKIICEGLDDKDFLTLLINKYLEIDEKKYDIEYMNGKSVLLGINNYKTLKKTKDKYTNMLFIFDCDFIDDDKKNNGMDNSEKKIEDLIKSLGLSNADYYIFNKNLDYFILDTLDNKEDFEACERCLNLKKVNKSRKILTCMYHKLYGKDSYNFSHKNFLPLKTKLQNLFKESH